MSPIRYFFNILRRGELIRDQEGDALADVKQAEALAHDILREMQRLPHVYGHPRNRRRDVFVTTDETGATVLRISCDALL